MIYKLINMKCWKNNECIEISGILIEKKDKNNISLKF